MDLSLWWRDRAYMNKIFAPIFQDSKSVLRLYVSQTNVFIYVSVLSSIVLVEGS